MDDDQEKFLDEARKVVKEQAYFMKKAIDQANLKDALRYSSTMLSELRTSVLSPKNYYMLFMQIFEHLHVLESAFKEEYRRGRKMINLYQSVQHATNLIPRLYLLITVGSVYIQTHEVVAIKILSDLLDMIKAVQHPLRGLFLRYYFLKMCKDRLPDKGSEYECQDCDVNDAISVIVRNLSEMNKLWIRMSGGSRDKPKREKERIDLKLTVGENLHRLSSLEGVNLTVYKENVLPKVLELIINSKDHISQQYLIDCSISTFPDEYHLATLQELLQCCTTQLESKVDTKTIFIRLMDRLADYSVDPDSNMQSLQSSEVDIYTMFKQNIDSMVNSASQAEFKNVLDLMVAFLKFTLRCYQEKSENVNSILKSCATICEKAHISDFDEDCQQNIVKFLTLPLETMSLSILTMNEYPNLMNYLPFNKKRQVATKICQAVINSKSPLNDSVITEQLLIFINPLLVTEKDYMEIDDLDFQDEQELVARTVHLIQNESVEVTWKILSSFIEKFKKGEVKRQRYTYPATYFALAKLIRNIKSSDQKLEYLDFNTLFKLIKDILETLQTQFPEIALKLYLQFIQVISEVDQNQEHDEFTYDLVETALMIYQDDLSDAGVKQQALYQIIGTLCNVKCLSEENYDTLISNTTQYSSKLLKKSDNCLSVLNCTHMFYNEHNKANQENVMQCLKKTLKIANVCLKNSVKNVGLYINIINKQFYFWNQINVKVQDIQECIDIIQNNIGALDKESDEESLRAKQYWKNTIAYIMERKQSDEKYNEINLSN